MRSRSSAAEPQPRVLDLGTGTGAIALAIADEHPGARVTAVDASSDALALARENAERLGLAGRPVATAAIETAAEGWDLVVSNPPYVAARTGARCSRSSASGSRAARSSAAGLHDEIAQRARTRRLVLEVGDGAGRRRRRHAEVARLRRTCAVTRDLPAGARGRRAAR